MVASVFDSASSNLFKKNRDELINLIADQEMSYPMEDRLTHATDGSLKFIDAYLLKNLLYKYKPSTILEIGSFLGFSTRWLLEVSSSWNAKVTAVDPNIRHRIFDNPRWFVERFNSKFYPNRLEIISGFFGEYSNEYAYYDYEHYEPKQDRNFVDRLLNTREIIDKNWSKKFDFIFIDGDHSYEAAMKNFAIAFNLLNDGGCIAFHDAVSWEEVNKALQDIKLEFKDKAIVKIYGNTIVKMYRNKILGKVMSKLKLPPEVDGIGFFKLLK